jgi:hypothetical protein
MSKPLSAHGQGSSDTQMRSTSKRSSEAPTLPHTRWAARQLHHGGESIHAATLPAHQRPRGSREAGAPSPGLVPTTQTCILDLRGNGGRFCFRTPTWLSVLAQQSREDASAHLGLLVLKPLHSHRLCRLVETRDDSRVHAPCGKQARERKGVLCCVGDQNTSRQRKS